MPNCSPAQKICPFYGEKTYPTEGTGVAECDKSDCRFCVDGQCAFVVVYCEILKRDQKK